jgi:hypothetical protein
LETGANKLLPSSVLLCRRFLVPSSYISIALILLAVRAEPLQTSGEMDICFRALLSRQVLEEEAHRST